MYIRDALKPLGKMDLDKLIAAVGPARQKVVSSLISYSWLPLKRKSQPQPNLRLNVLPRF